MTEPMELTREMVEQIRSYFQGRISQNTRYKLGFDTPTIAFWQSILQVCAAALRDIESRETQNSVGWIGGSRDKSVNPTSLSPERECNCPQCWDAFGNPVDIHMASCTKAATPQPAGDAEELVKEARRAIDYTEHHDNTWVSAVLRSLIARIEADQARIRELEQADFFKCPKCGEWSFEDEIERNPSTSHYGVIAGEVVRMRVSDGSTNSVPASTTASPGDEEL